MRLDDAAIYVITATRPTNPANMKVGDTVEVWLSRRPIGRDFPLLVKLTRLNQNGDFQGEVIIEPTNAKPQLVGGSFFDPDPDLHIIAPRSGS